jgi:hypothetical protein
LPLPFSPALSAAKNIDTATYYFESFGGRAKKKKKKAPADVAWDAGYGAGGGSFFSAGERIPRLSTHTLSEYISVATAPTLIYR